MKKIKFICAFLLASWVALMSSQTATTLNNGGWSTSNTNSLTCITMTNTAVSKIYRIECTMLADLTVLEFSIIVDGATITATFFEGASVIVEGKSIFIKQNTPGKLVKGTWSVIQVADVPAMSIPWVGYTTIKKDILVANLNTAQDFILSINLASIGCTNTAMNVVVDGVTLNDQSGKPIEFFQGSSVFGNGKKIVIRVSGTCTQPAGTVVNTVNGDLRVKRQ